MSRIPSQPMPAVLLLCAAGLSAHAGVFIGFEGLPASPARDARGSLFDANGGSHELGGVTWDSRLNVVGDQHRTSADPANPLSSLPHGGNFFITNDSYPDAGDAITLATSMVLTGAWFSQVEYYGFGHGAMTVTVDALAGATVVGSASVNLPANAGPGPLPMEFLDSSSFLSAAGITSYRIKQSPLDAGSRHWSADDFQFSVVPEPSSVMLATSVALAGVGVLRRIRGRAEAARERHL